MKYFSKERINTGRQLELDLLKAICIVGMIAVHIILDLGDNIIPDSVDSVGTEVLGAATFMLCMGVGMRYSRNQSPSAYVARGVGLLTIAQFLNILRNVIPNLIAYWIIGGNFFISNSLLILQSDILTFAGLAFLLIALFKKFRVSDAAILGISVAMSLFALIIFNLVPSPENYLVSQMLGFLIITDAEAYFPLCCYFIFVAFGYFIGGVYPRIKDKDGLSTRILLIGLPIVIAYYILRLTVIPPVLPALGSDLQYNMKPTPDAIINCITTLCWLAFFHKLIKLFKNRLPRPIMHFSQYINSYYCISYMFVLPVQTILVAVTGSLIKNPVVAIVYTVIVVFACYFIIEINERYLHIHFSTLTGKKKIAFMVFVWGATVATVIYAYPRITEFANIWNEYLLP